MTSYAVVRILDDEKLSLTEFFARYVAHASTYQQPSTIRCVYKPAMGSFFAFSGELNISEINQTMCEKWVVSFRSKIQPHSLRTRVIALRSVFNYAIENGWMSKNPLVNMKLPPPKFAGRLLSDEDLNKFLSAIAHAGVSNACRLSLYCGFRSSEILSLTWEQVLNDRIVIPPEKSKSKRGRVVLIHPKARHLLGVPGQGDVFNFCQATLLRHVRLAWQKAGIGRLRFHDMRHNWATRYFEESNDPWAVMDAGGWANEQSMRPYQHMNRARQEKIYGIRYSFDKA